MSDYYDADGRLLGQWELCDEERFLAAMTELGDKATVFASRTVVGEMLPQPQADPLWRDRHMYTEWGDRGADLPTCRCEDIWDGFGRRQHADALFVRFTVTEDEVA